MNRLLENAWARFKDFSAVGGTATYFWPSWIILRSVGFVYGLIFAGIIDEGQALVGPEGLMPAQNVLAALAKQYPNPVEAFLHAPGLLWLNASGGMVTLLPWLGLAAAIAVVLNVWPRMAMFACWLIFLSFASLGNFFSVTAPDPLMLEVGLLCIPLAPPGYLPGWFARTAPPRLAVFALRWMFLRLVIEAGLSKYVYGSALWFNFTMMDVMHETTPFPTALGFWDHHLPHAFHVGEIALTFAAEIIAPLLAVFGRRPWRWFAFWVWAVFQAGIELTNNFGWLNVAAIALAVILLDDEMLVGALDRFKFRKLSGFLAARVAALVPRAMPPWAKWALGGAVGVQFAAAMFFYLVAPLRIPIEQVPAFITKPVVLLLGGWRSANAYPLFGGVKLVREVVEYAGSNDGGETWRTYEYRYLPHRVDQVSPFIAPWYPRFEHTIQTTMLFTPSPVLYQAVAAHLLRRDPRVIKLFRTDPFADRPATMIRISTQRLSFTDPRTYRATGRYWRKEYQGEYAPMMFLGENGEINTSE